MQRRLSDSDVNKDDMYLQFKIANISYIIGIGKIQSVSEKLRFHESYQLSHPHILGTNYTINGNAIVFDLRIYFGVDHSNEPKTIHIQDENRNNFILLVDAIVDYVEVENRNLIKEIYPITNTQKTYYKGICEIDGNLTFVLSDQTLLTYLSSNESVIYGDGALYKFNEVTDTLPRDFDLETTFNQFMWIGYESRIGYQLEDILHVYHYPSLNQWKRVETISTMGYQDIPLFNTCEFFKNTFLDISENESCSIIVMKLDEKIIAFLAIGNIDIKNVESYGNLLTSGLKKIIFENQSYVSDYMDMDNFIGFLVDFKSIIKDLVGWEKAPNYIDQVVDRSRETMDFVTIDADLPIAFELSTIKSISRFSTIEKTGVYDLLTYLNQKEMKVIENGTKNQVCIEFQDSDLYFSTDYEISIRKFYSDQVNPHEQTLVMKDDKTYQLISHI